jgi:hypothetical protein
MEEVRIIKVGNKENSLNESGPLSIENFIKVQK